MTMYRNTLALMVACLGLASCTNTQPIDIPIPAYTTTVQAVVGGPSISVSVPAQIVTIPAHPQPSATPIAVKVVAPVKK